MTEQESSRWQGVASVPEGEFEPHLAETQKNKGGRPKETPGRAPEVFVPTASDVPASSYHLFGGWGVKTAVTTLMSHSR